MIVCLALSVSLDVTYLVDDYRIGEIHRPQTILRLAGGKALNMARAARFLGADVSVVGIVGGSTGTLVRSLLAAIPANLVNDIAETRTCVSVASAGALTEIYEYATPIGVDAWTEFMHRVDALRASPGDWLVLSGSVPVGVLHDELAALLGRCAAAGFRIAVDTHGPALAALLPVADLVKVNRGEATDLLRAVAETGLEDLARGIRSRGKGTATVIVTDGTEGALGITRNSRAEDEVVHVHGDPVRGGYPVGSGDSFLGGLLVKLDGGFNGGFNGGVEGGGFEDALLEASAVASANAQRPGGALFDRSEVEAARQRIAASSGLG